MRLFWLRIFANALLLQKTISFVIQVNENMKKVKGVIKMKRLKKKRSKSSKKTDTVKGDAKKQYCISAEIIKSIDDLLRLCTLQGNMLKHIRKKLERLKG